MAQKYMKKVRNPVSVEVKCYFCIWNHKDEEPVVEDLYAKNCVERYINHIKHMLDDMDLGVHVDKKDKENIMSVVEKTSNLIAADPDGPKETYDEHLLQLQAICDPPLAAAHKRRTALVAMDGLQRYLSVVKQILDEKKNVFDAADAEKLLSKYNEGIRWLDRNQTAEKDEFEHQQKDLESECNPIITKLYQAAGGPPNGMPGGVPGAPGGASSTGPTIGEMD